MCFRSRLAEFQAEFDVNPLFLHISHFSRSVRSQTTLTRHHKNAQKKHTYPHNRMPLGRVVHKGYCSRYLAAHNCTTSGFQASLQFRGLLGCSSYTIRTYSATLPWYPRYLSHIQIMFSQYLKNFFKFEV